MCNFKLRAADLLDVYLRRHGGSPLALGLVPSLLQAIDVCSHDSSSGAALQAKLAGLLGRRLCRAKDIPRVPAVEEERVLGILEDVFKFAHSAVGVQPNQLASTLSLYLIRVLCGHCGTPAPSMSPAALERVVQLYRGALEDYLSRKGSRFQSGFFTDLAVRQPRAAWHLVATALAGIRRMRSPYLAIQAVQFIGSVLRQWTLLGLSMTQLVQLWPDLQAGMLCIINGNAGLSSSPLPPQKSHDVHGKHLREVLAFCRQTLLLLSRLGGKAVGASVDAAPLREAVKRLAENHASPVVRSLAISVLDALRVGPHRCVASAPAARRAAWRIAKRPRLRASVCGCGGWGVGRGERRRKRAPARHHVPAEADLKRARAEGAVVEGAPDRSRPARHTPAESSGDGAVGASVAPANGGVRHRRRSTVTAAAADR